MCFCVLLFAVDVPLALDVDVALDASVNVVVCLTSPEAELAAVDLAVVVVARVVVVSGVDAFVVVGIVVLVDEVDEVVAAAHDNVVVADLV